MHGFDPVEVIAEEYEPFGLFDSVVIFHGTATSGHKVKFGVDANMAPDIIEALEGGDSPLVELEPWQILGSSPAVMRV